VVQYRGCAGYLCDVASVRLWLLKSRTVFLADVFPLDAADPDSAMRLKTRNGISVLKSSYIASSREASSIVSQPCLR